MKDEKIRKIVIAAMLAALCCVATMSIRIPTFATNGYVNAGDIVVLLSAWLVGGVYGALAAGIGSGMADLLSGYTHYVPGTFLIKFTMAVVAALIVNALLKRRLPKAAAYITSAAAAELTMIAGYFLYQSTLLGYGLAASASIPGNIAQGATCAAAAVVLIGALGAAKIPMKMTT